MNIRTLFEDFIHLIYPHLCASCNASLYAQEDGICNRCRYNLPSLLYDAPENPASKKFWGRFPFGGATALFEFRKAGKVQRLIHNIKYRHRKDAAEAAGKMLGAKLAQLPDFQNIDGIIPVPMHPAKLRRRGYNQALLIADGVSKTLFKNEMLNPRALKGVLLKTKNTKTQTQKGRADRFANLQETFSLDYELSVTLNILRGCHLLLVDDVITTGATIEACATQLLKIKGVKVSIATLADVNF